MPITVNFDFLAANLDSLLNQLDAGTLDSVEVVDGQTATDGTGAAATNTRTFSVPSTPSAKLVPWTDFAARNQANSALDLEVDAQNNLQVNSGGWMRNALYQLSVNLREVNETGLGGATQGSLTVDGASSPNGDIVYTAVAPGAQSALITIEHEVAGNNTARSIVVSGTSILVNVATDGGGAVDSTETATAIAAAINADADASLLVTAEAQGTGAALVADAAEDSLSAGTDPLGTAGPRVIGIKRTKNDTNPRAVLLAYDVATAMGL